MVDRLGVVLPARCEATLRRHVRLAQDAERHGYGTVWSGEVTGADAIGLSCAIATSTERIRVGVGIVPVFTRTAPLLAMGAATLRSLAGDRAVLGLGVSTPKIIAGWHGAGRREPATRLTETTMAVRHVLARESGRFAGETVSFEGFDLMIEGELKVPVYVAALGPKGTARAATYADGVIVALNTTEHLAALAREISAAAGSRRVRVTAYTRVGINDDEAAVERWMRREIAWYCASAAYRTHLARQGFAAQMEAVAEAWARGDAAAARAAIDRELCLRLAAAGSAAEVRTQLAAMLEHVDEVACYFMDFGGGLEQIATQMKRLAFE